MQLNRNVTDAAGFLKEDLIKDTFSQQKVKDRDRKEISEMSCRNLRRYLCRGRAGPSPQGLPITSFQGIVTRTGGTRRRLFPGQTRAGRHRGQQQHPGPRGAAPGAAALSPSPCSVQGRCA